MQGKPGRYTRKNEKEREKKREFEEEEEKCHNHCATVDGENKGRSGTHLSRVELGQLALCTRRWL